MFNPLGATTLGALEQTVVFTERRHELLAGNIANLSTPDYRSRDLDVDEFRKELARSIREPVASQSDRSQSGTANDGPSAMLEAVRWPGVLPGILGHPHLSEEAEAASMSTASRPNPRINLVGPTEAHTRDDRWSGPRSAMESIVYHDGSDVSLEEQVNQISKNKHMHNLAITTMRNQFELLRAAITERA